MIATVVNALVIVIGSLIGTFFRSRLSQKFNDCITMGLGLCVIVIGISTALETQNMIIVIASVALGGLLGTWIDIEKRLNHLGTLLEKRFASAEDMGSFARGFVSASLLFCVGAMAIVGSLDAGLRGDYNTLYAKSVLDFISSIFIAGTYGIGAMLSAVTVLVYQGAITLLAGVVEPILSDAVVAEMSAVGGVLILGIGLNMIRKEHIPVGNLLPGILLPILILAVF